MKIEKVEFENKPHEWFIYLDDNEALWLAAKLIDQIRMGLHNIITTHDNCTYINIVVKES